MKFGVFSHARGAYAPNRFQQEAEKLGLEADTINYGELDFEVGKSGVTVILRGQGPLPFFDLAIFRSAGGDAYYVPQRDYLLSDFESKGAVILNKDTYKRWGRLDKLTQSFILQQKNLPFVETQLFPNVGRLKQNLTFPSVIKVYFGSQGKKVFRVDDWSKVEEILALYPPNTLLIQPMLPPGEDVRVIVLGDKPLGAMKRIAQEGQFLTNYSQGGRVEKLELDEKMIELSVGAAKAFNLEYVGVDLMKDKEGHWRILEVNRACQFEGFEKATGINVPKAVIEYLLKKKTG